MWPELPYAAWRDTLQTVHLWTQIVGKVRLALTPWLNHSWHVPFYVTARGLGTSPMPIGDEYLEIDFDFIAHRLVVRTSRGDEDGFALAPQTVAEFHRRVFALLRGLGIAVAIDDMPSEIANATRFSDDSGHASYDPDAVHRFWRALVQIDRVFKLFRSGFLGKASPVHFFWGSFDLAATRFSGRGAPRHPGGVPGLSDAVACEAYSHEESSAGGVLFLCLSRAGGFPRPGRDARGPFRHDARRVHPALRCRAARGRPGGIAARLPVDHLCRRRGRRRVGPRGARMSLRRRRARAPVAALSPPP
jgi:hypothetical protein